MLTNSDVQKMKRMGVTVIYSNCDPIAADDKSLPSSSYLVTCKEGDDQWYDIAVSYTHLRSPRDRQKSRMPSSA